MRRAADAPSGRWWTLAAVCGATFMLLIDITIVQVALPSIQRDLAASFSSLQWVIDAYTLTLASFQLGFGSLADRIGRKRVFVGGVILFSLASLLCGLSTSALMLNLSRGLQGVGGGAMFATSLALIGQEFSGKERGSAIAAWGATVGGAVGIGPLLGGAITQGIGWQWIFFVNLPIGGIVLAVCAMWMRNVSDPGARRVDVAGMVTFSGTLALWIFAILRGNDDGWASGRIAGSFAAGAVLLAAFLVVELRQRRPMFDLSLFRKPSFGGVSVANFAIGAGMFAAFPYITLYLQNVLGLSPFEGGVRLLPATLLIFIVPMATRNLAGRLPPGRILAVGMALIGVGLLMMGGLSPDSTWTALLFGLLVAGAGIGLSNPAIASIALGVVDPARSGMASGISNTFRVTGVATGVAALGAFFEHRLGTTLSVLLPHAPAGLAGAVASGGLRAVAASVPAAARPHAVTAARAAFVSGLNLLLRIGACTAFVGAAFSLLVRERDFFRRRDPEPAPVGEISG